jgi:hypothetical protein
MVERTDAFSDSGYSRFRHSAISLFVHGRMLGNDKAAAQPICTGLATYCVETVDWAWIRSLKPA